MTYTHAELVAAIDYARIESPRVMEDGGVSTFAGAQQHNAHLDTLAAVLDLHYPVTDEVHPVICHGCLLDDPCPTVQAVADALTRMGCLP